MPACPRERCDGRHGNVVPEDQWGSTCSSASSIENDVVDTYVQCGVDVLLNVLRRQLEANGYATGSFAYFVREIAVLTELGPIGETRRRNGGLALFQSSYLGDLSFHLVTGQMTTGTCFGTLAAFEVKRLSFLDFVPGKSESSRGQLVKIS